MIRSLNVNEWRDAPSLSDRKEGYPRVAMIIFNLSGETNNVRPAKFYKQNGTLFYEGACEPFHVVAIPERRTAWDLGLLSDDAPLFSDRVYVYTRHFEYCGNDDDGVAVYREPPFRTARRTNEGPWHDDL